MTAKNKANCNETDVLETKSAENLSKNSELAVTGKQEHVENVSVAFWETDHRYSEPPNPTIKKRHCDTCGKTFRTPRGLNVHMRMHAEVEAFACDVCDYRTNLLGNLKTHMLIHLPESERKFQCDICGKVLSAKESLKFHKHLHDQPESSSYSCPVCKKLFAKMSSLDRHMYQHNKQPKPFNCTMCDKSYITAADLKRHEALHFQIKQFVCEFCNKNYPSAFHLQKHRYTHKREKNLLCETCGRKFSCPSRLRDHKLSHSESKPHTCEICNKSYPRARALKRHMIVHDEKKLHLCSLCGKEFSFEENLKQHKLTHTGEKGFCCDVCGKLFKFNRDLVRHKLIHVDDMPHECNVCGKRCRYLSNLYKHMQVHERKTGSEKADINQINVPHKRKRTGARHRGSLSLISQKEDTVSLDNSVKEYQAFIYQSDSNEFLKTEFVKGHCSSILDAEVTRQASLDSTTVENLPKATVDVNSDISENFLNSENDEVSDENDIDNDGAYTDYGTGNAVEIASDRKETLVLDYGTQQFDTGAFQTPDSQRSAKPNSGDASVFHNKNTREAAPLNPDIEIKHNIEHQQSLSKEGKNKQLISVLRSDKSRPFVNDCFAEQVSTEHQHILEASQTADKTAEGRDQIHLGCGAEAEMNKTVTENGYMYICSTPSTTTMSSRKRKQYKNIEETYHCELCPINFRLYDTLIMHMLHVHGIDESEDA